MVFTRAQAFDTMKLLIAAVIAVGILGILNTILGRMSSMAYGDPFDAPAQILKSVSGSPGVTRNTDICMLKKGDIYTASAYKSKALLTTQSVVVVCGQGVEGLCTDGIYPPSAPQETLTDMEEDVDIQRYWGSATAHSDQSGQVGPAPADTPVQFSISCGQTYCRITMMAG